MNQLYRWSSSVPAFLNVCSVCIHAIMQYLRSSFIPSQKEVGGAAGVCCKVFWFGVGTSLHYECSIFRRGLCSGLVRHLTAVVA